MYINKRKLWIVLILLFSAALSGCGIETTDGNRVKDLDFTIVDEYHIPQTLREEIEAQKEMNFKLSYECDGVLYIARGYGEQETGGYSISVNDLYLSSNAVCIETTLLGPGENDTVSKSPSFPYIVVCVACENKNVCFL
ncbi:MAG: protease complex subunit PrcB family protein [Roseburia sp.]